MQPRGRAPEVQFVGDDDEIPHESKIEVHLSSRTKIGAPGRSMQARLSIRFEKVLDAVSTTGVC
ncbi:hypothetical protein GCM10025773_39780 [Microbacterium jejuense]